MRPRSIGRTVGIGLRVAGRVVGQRVAGSVQSAVSAPSPGVPAQAAAVDLPAKERAAGQAAGKATVRATGGIGRGVAGFLRPFQRVGGILWLEVTGVFFLVFVLAFAPVLWRTRLSYAHGQDQRTFWAAAIIIAVFLYLSISSFWKARKR
jgi:hypothetical protein